MQKLGRRSKRRALGLFLTLAAAVIWGSGPAAAQGPARLAPAFASLSSGTDADLSAGGVPQKGVDLSLPLLSAPPEETSEEVDLIEDEGPPVVDEIEWRRGRLGLGLYRESHSIRSDAFVQSGTWKIKGALTRDGYQFDFNGFNLRAERPVTLDRFFGGAAVATLRR